MLLKQDGRGSCQGQQPHHGRAAPAPAPIARAARSSHTARSAQDFSLKNTDTTLTARRASARAAPAAGRVRRSGGLDGPVVVATEMGRLLHAQVFYRHGARTPQSAFEPPADWSGTTDAAAKLALCQRVVLADADGEPLPFEAVRADGSLTSDAELQLLPGGAWAGDLTVVGLLEAQALGERLRQRYSHLLRRQQEQQQQEEEGSVAQAAACSESSALQKVPTIKHSIEVRSTPMRRTIETAMGVLSTLIPPEKSEEEASSHCTIQLNTDDINKDWMLG
eukprot:COSAG06_NODE_7805_length_2368_cov_3.452182_1_plen_279_part_00